MIISRTVKAVIALQLKHSELKFKWDFKRSSDAPRNTNVCICFECYFPQTAKDGLHECHNLCLDKDLTCYHKTFRIELYADPLCKLNPFQITPVPGATLHRTPQRRYASVQFAFINCTTIYSKMRIKQSVVVPNNPSKM